MDVTLRPARGNEAAIISALALRSKGHWGYDEEFLEACREELTWTPTQLASGDVAVAERAGVVVGFFLLTGDGERGELDALFVDPPAIGTGVGGVLMRAALQAARGRGYRRIGIDADPGAEPFYMRYGARRVAEVPSGSIPCRLLPRLEIAL